MPTTYSISQGVTYAETFPNFQSVLNVLPDNTQKLIAPRDVRDSFFTAWENIVFKKTNVSSSDVEYIGIDRDTLTQKVYFGKKTVGGQEVMNNNLLNDDVDFYFYNTKTEPQETYHTKIAILAGTVGNFYYEGNLTTPYLESRVVDTSYGGYLNFEIRNKSYIYDGTDRFGGDINILSDKGYVSLNGVVFPKYVENMSPDNDGKYLKFVWTGFGAYATWSTVEIPNQPDPIDPSNIFFTDATPTPQALGGIPQESTFDNVPVTEMFRKLLYPYLKPSVSSSFEYGVIESGDDTKANLQKLNYTIKRAGTYSITGRNLVPPDLKPGTPGFIDPGTVPQDNVGVSSYVNPVFNVYLPNGTNNSAVSTTLTITDANGTSVTSTASFNIVLPWYYGVSTTATNTAAGINGILGKTASPSTPNKLTPDLKTSATPTSVTLTTVGLGAQACIYFGYPSSYGDLISIKDPNNFEYLNVSSPDFEQYTISGITSPNSYWGGPSDPRVYKFYIYTRNTGSPQTTTIGGLSKYIFSFS